MAVLKRERREGHDVVSVRWKVKLAWSVGEGLMSPPTTEAPWWRRRVVVARPMPEEQPLGV